MPQEYKSKSTKQQVEDVDNDQINSVSVDDFDVNKLRIPPIDDKRSSDTHFHSFPVYEYDNGKEDKLILTTGEIEITKGGIPRLDEKWRKSDAKREFMWLGIDEAQPECKKLFDALRSIDNHFDGLISFDSDGKKDNNIESQTVYTTKDKKKKDPLTNLEYSPLVKLSVQGGDGTQKEDQPEYVPYERIKLRFSKKYDKDRVEGEPSELTTLLFVGEKENEEDCKYPSDFEKFLRWKCTARFVLQFSKFRTKKVAEKDKKGKSLQRDCAFDINMLHVYITKEAPNAGVSNADKYRKRFFPPTMKSTKSQDVEEKQKAKNDESSEESSNDENEKQPVKSTKEKDTKQKPKSKQESESESESESEEEEIPAKKTNAKTNKAPVKNTKKVNSDSEDSSEESDSEDDKSEEEKPKSKKSSR